MTFAGVIKLFEDIFAVWCAVNDVVITDLAVIHGETVVMLGGNCDVFHPGGFYYLAPLIRIEIDRVELAG